MRGLFVTATDTGVGKTVLACALAGAIAAEGEAVRAHKPVLTGLEEAHQPDHELLAAAAGMSAQEVAPLRYGPAVSPHLAAALAGEPIDPLALVARAEAAAGPGALIVEGVGGLLTPLTETFSVCDFAAALALPVVIAARPGLGTINHTLLTLAAARAAALEVRAVVLTPWPARPGAIERSNRDTIARIGFVDVHVLRPVDPSAHDQLARAGAGLPWRSWLRERAGG